jgi:hypothetical protein
VKQALLDRLETGDEGTMGWLRLYADEALASPPLYECATLELPWRENARRVSCVPAGVYLFKLRTDSPKHGKVYEEWDDPETPEREDVLDRDNVQIHAANLAGDTAKGYVAQLLGCIAPGLSVVQFRAGAKPAGDKDQRGVSASKTALAQLMAALNDEVFRLTIRWADGIGPVNPTVGGLA